jgi:hypothetical protein
MRPAPAIDWNRVFLTLRREGYTTRDVSSIVGIPRSTIDGWRTGAEPRHQDGETIIQFWSETTGLPRESLPLSRGGFTSHLAARRTR